MCAGCIIYCILVYVLFYYIITIDLYLTVHTQCIRQQAIEVSGNNVIRCAITTIK